MKLWLKIMPINLREFFESENYTVLESVTRWRKSSPNKIKQEISSTFLMEHLHGVGMHPHFKDKITAQKINIKNI